MATEECFDELDETTGAKTGRVVTRSQAHKEGRPHRVVHTWIVDSKGNLLLQQRHWKKDSFPGMWDISSAGHISAGDDSRESALRELEEELGLVVDGSKLELLFTHFQSFVLNGGTFINKEWVDVYLLQMDGLDISTMRLQATEVTAVKFLHYRQYHALLLEHDPQYVPIQNIDVVERFVGILAARYP
ncbi:Nudix hydrolase 3 [Pelomyxa schiedti]|nr:Nudix hydrolase 3 [Pelomyxa schiedti]